MVCLGNICRSPTAHGVFLSLLERHDLTDKISVDSCGTAAFHEGSAPDSRATAAALSRGYDLSTIRARQVVASDFQQFDYILAMDRTNLGELRAHCPSNFSGHLGLFLDFSNSDLTEVPDPYYGDGDGFATVLDLVEETSAGLLGAVCRDYKIAYEHTS